MKDQFISVEHLLLALIEGQEPGASRCSRHSESTRRKSFSRSKRFAAGNVFPTRTPRTSTSPWSVMAETWSNWPAKARSIR